MFGQLKQLFSSNKSKQLKQSKVFCMAPWIHLHALPGGNVYPCCQSAHLSEAAIGNLQETASLEDIWNSAKMKALRTGMLKGETQRICEKCYEEEGRGQHTFRNTVNTIFEHHFDKVNRTLPDGTADLKPLPYLDIRFSNLCNFRCRICGPAYSTAWYDDAVALNPSFGLTHTKQLQVANNMEAFWQMILPHIDALEYVQFAGGEPMLMKEHYEILHRLDQLQKHDVRITYNTNLSTVQYQRHNMLELWSKFSNIFIMASLDGMGPRGEYLRKGQNWPKTEGILKAIRTQCPNVKLRVDPTLSIHNVFHIPDFYQYLVQNDLIDAEMFRLNLLYDPIEYNIINLTPEAKLAVEQHYALAIEQMNSQFLLPKSVEREFKAVLMHMRSDSGQGLAHFWQTTKRFDQLRKEDFLSTFPEFKPYSEAWQAVAP